MAKFEKGHKGYKPKGAVSEKTKQWNVLQESVVSTHTDRFNEILSNSNDETFVKLYLEVLKYFKPQLQRTELKAEVSAKDEQLFIIGDMKIPFN